MSAARKTCDRCAHYDPQPEYEGQYVPHGECAKSLDWNDVRDTMPADRMAGADYESYRADVVVGPKFGCIHWTKRKVAP